MNDRDAELDRQSLMLASLARLRAELFGDLLARDDVANVLVLPPAGGSASAGWW